MPYGYGFSRPRIPITGMLCSAKLHVIAFRLVNIVLRDTFIKIVRWLFRSFFIREQLINGNVKQCGDCHDVSMSGIPASVSHFVTACLDTPSFSASCSCDIPVCLRMDFNFSANVMFVTSLFWYAQYRKVYFALQASRDYISTFSATLRGIFLFIIIFLSKQWVE